MVFAALNNFVGRRVCDFQDLTKTLLPWPNDIWRCCTFEPPFSIKEITMKHTCRRWRGYKLWMILASGLFGLDAAPVAVIPAWTGLGLVTGGGTFESGTPLSLEAVPQVDWSFDHWDGVDAAVSRVNPLSVTAGSGTVPTAVFVTAPHNGWMNDGTLTQWANQLGQFGEMKPAPADVGIAEIAAGPTSFLVRRIDGTIATWTYVNSQGGIFGEMVATPPDGLSDVISVAVGKSSAMALRSNGSVAAWQQGLFKIYNPTDLPTYLWTLPPGLKPIVGISPDGGLLDEEETTIILNGGPYPLTIPNRSPRSLVSSRFSYGQDLYQDAHPDVVKWFPNPRWSARYEVHENGTLEITSSNVFAFGAMPNHVDHVVDIVMSDLNTLVLRASAFGLFKSAPPSIRLQVGDPFAPRPQWVSATGYQWYRDGTPLPGMTNRTLNLASVQEADSGVYQQIATDGNKRFAGPATRVSVFPIRVAALYLDGRRIVENQATIHGSAVLTLESTLGGTVFYTTDGSEPTPFSTLYTTPVTVSRTSTVRALAFSSDFSSSGQSQALQVSVVPAFFVTTSVTGNGSVNGVVSGAKIDGGTTLTLTAVPGSGWKFDHWEGGITGASASASLTVNGDASVKAVFVLIPPPAQYVVELTTDGGGVARLSAGVGGGNSGKGASVTYTEGTTYTMTATPDAGWSFVGWTGAYTGTDSPVTRAATAFANSIAVFGTTVATSAVGGGHVTLDPDLPIYPYGTRVHIVPAPDTGKLLAAWGSSGAGNLATDWYLTVTTATPSISALFAAAPAPLTQTITVTQVADQKFGTPSVALSATASSGLPVTFTVVSGPGQLNGSTLSLSGAGTIVVRADQAGDSRYEPASATLSVVVAVARFTQTITVTQVADQKFGTPSVALSATASSGLPVAFTVVSGPGQIIGNALLLGGVGTIVVRADQAGNSQFEAASATLSIVVNPGTQTITFDPPTSLPYFPSEALVLEATASSGQSVSFKIESGPGSLVANILLIKGSGTIVITASAGATEVYPAVSVTRSIVVGSIGKTQLITFDPIADQVLGGAPLVLSATASSGLGVTYSVVDGPAVVEGATVRFTGMGLVHLAADQAGDANYVAALSVVRAVQVAPGLTATFNPAGSPDGNRLSIILDAGVQADVEESMDLGNWITLGSVQGRGAVQPVSFTLGGGTATSRFWRLRVRP